MLLRQKTHDALVFYLKIENSVLNVEFGKIKLHENDLLKTFVICKKIGLNYFCSYYFKLFKNLMVKNLLSTNPLIKLLQFYKLSYMCEFDLTKKPNQTD